MMPSQQHTTSRPPVRAMPRVGVIGAQRRMQALYAIGHRKTDLAARLGCSPYRSNIPFMASGAFTMPVELAEKVDALYQELRTIPGPAQRSPNWEPKLSWIKPHEWAGLDIDNPRHNPRQTPARTTRHVPDRRTPSAGDYTTDGRLMVCRTYRNADLWFADLGSTDYHHAMRACLDCPVRRDCAEQGIASNEEYGIWGGINSQDRNRLRKRLVKRLGARPIAGSNELTDVLNQFLNPESGHGES